MSRSLATIFRGFIDSTDRSIPAKSFRVTGLFVSIPYSILVRFHHGLYDLGIRRSKSVSVPVISVGNITMGGVGKTPLVAWLTDFLLSCGKSPGLISRGYKAKEQSAVANNTSFLSVIKLKTSSQAPLLQYRLQNDEAREFAIHFPQVPYFLGHKRVEVANALLKGHPQVDVLLLDDAFQHRSISRDLNILVLDALNPFGGGHVCPSGFLREPVSAISRADAVLLNRADLVDKTFRLNIRESVQKLAPHTIWAEIIQRPRAMYYRHCSESSPEVFTISSTPFNDWKLSFADKRVLAFCGLGAPEGFKRTLINEKINVVSFIEYPDHCIYRRADIERLARAADDVNADLIVGTMKDFVKFHGNEPLPCPLYALDIGVCFLDGETDFCNRIKKLLHID